MEEAEIIIFTSLWALLLLLCHFLPFRCGETITSWHILAQLCGLLLPSKSKVPFPPHFLDGGGAGAGAIAALQADSHSLSHIHHTSFSFGGGGGRPIHFAGSH